MPGNPRERNPLATPAGAASLAVVLVTLVAAIVLLPGRLAPEASRTSGPETASPLPGATPGGPATAGPLASFVRPTPTPDPAPTPAPTFTSHVVGAGESLNTIAHAFATTARSLAWWNRGAYPSLDPTSETYDPNHIEPGWVLVLIPGARVDEANPPTPSPGPPTPSPSIDPLTTPSPS